MSGHPAGADSRDPGREAVWKGGAMQDEPESRRVGDTSHEALLVSVGARIREARKLANLTQTDLAKAVGSGQSYIYQIETGEANITLKTLFRIAVVVGLSPRDLLPDEHPGQMLEVLQATMQEFQRFSEQLQRLHTVISGDQSASSPTPPEG